MEKGSKKLYYNKKYIPTPFPHLICNLQHPKPNHQATMAITTRSSKASVPAKKQAGSRNSTKKKGKQVAILGRDNEFDEFESGEREDEDEEDYKESPPPKKKRKTSVAAPVPKVAGSRRTVKNGKKDADPIVVAGPSDAPDNDDDQLSAEDIEDEEVTKTKNPPNNSTRIWTNY